MTKRNGLILIFLSAFVISALDVLAVNFWIFPAGGDGFIWKLIVLAAVNLLIISGLIILYYCIVALPVKRIAKYFDKLSSGEFDIRIKTKTRDRDIKLIAECFNKIASDFENLEQSRKSFVSNTSHELRSPLTSMQGFLQAMLDGTIKSEADRIKYLNIVFNETKRLTTMINSMLDLSRMESGRSPLSRIPFDIHELIRRAVVKFEPNLSRKDIKMDVQFCRQQVMVFADRERIEQVLINIIDNAIKYSPNFSQIYLNTYIQQKKVYISVKDNGYGISKKDQMLIWDRFYMTDKARTPVKEKGTGLGLSIVKKIMDEHGELVWVDSVQGHGATFTFTLAIFDPLKHKQVKEAAPVKTMANDK